MELTDPHSVYICPQCKGPLDAGGEAFSCRRCSRTYPVVLGIPDFRVFADPYISIPDDHRKGMILAEHAQTLTFSELVAKYWEMTPGVPADLVQEYTRHAVAGSSRAMHTWEAIRDATAAPSFEAILEVGCGTGGFLVLAGAAAPHTVGVDIAFRWLVVARKRLEEAGLRNVRLVCACAEFLPFADDDFGLVVADDVLDHTRDPERFIAESVRVMQARTGLFFLSTPNRFSLAPDPHVWVWGVGYIPAPLRDRYVRWRKGVSFGPIRPVSYPRLRRLLAQDGVSSRISVPPLRQTSHRALPPWQVTLLRLYNALTRTPGIRNVLLLVGPMLHAVARKVPLR